MPLSSTGVHVRDLHYEIARRVILDSLTLQVGSGESVAVTGPSGCGKSTLLGCLAGLTPPTRGTITVDGTEVTSLSPGRRAAVRLKTIGMVYQFGELLPELSPLENVALPALMAGAPAADTYARAQALLERNPTASETEIRVALEPNLCRCGTHMRIIRAVKRAAGAMAGA